MPNQLFGIDIEFDSARVERGTERVTRNLGSMRTAAGAVQSVVNRLIGLFASLATAFSLSRAIREALRFNKAMAEVSTLVNTATFNLGRLQRQALANAAAFGSNVTDQARAFYQAISSGASSAADATELVTAANRLAVGGMTDVFVATDGLTSILNAYGLEASEAEGVSDALFVAMRAGKTTIGELASSLGRVTPLAAATGVSFDELAAAVSALTLAGITTREATTGVRAILAAVAKPTSEAAKLANQLGLEFNAAGLEAMGLQGFLANLLEVTGGNTDQLSLLFGGVEALLPILSLAGSAGEDFAAILEDMGVKAGETDLAVSKIEDTVSFQAGRLWPAFLAQITAVGTALISNDGLVPILRTLADNMDLVVGSVGAVGAAIAVAFAPQIIAAIGAAKNALIALNVAAAANPYVAIAAAVALLIGLLITFRKQIADITIGSVRLGDIFTHVMRRINMIVEPVVKFFRDFWTGAFDDVSDGLGRFLSFYRKVFITIANIVKFVVNRIIGYWDGFLRLLGLLINSIVPAFQDIWAQVSNATSAFIERIVRGFGVMVGSINTALNAIVDGASTVVNTVRGVFAGAVAFIAAAWSDLPAVLTNIGQRAINGIIDSIGTGLSAIGRSIQNTFRRLTGRDALEGELTNSLEQFRFNISDESAAAGDAAAQAFNDAYAAAQMEGFSGTLPTELFADFALPRREITGAAREAVAGVRQIFIDAATRDYIGDAFSGLLSGGASVAAARRAENQRRAITDRFDPRSQAPEIPEGVLPQVNAAFDEALGKSTELQAAVARLQAIIQGDQGAALESLTIDAQSGRGGFLSSFLTSIDEAFVKTRSFAGDAGRLFGNLANQIGNGLADSIGRAIVFAEDLGTSLRNIARNALAELISGFVKLGIQFVTTRALSGTLAAAATATATAQGAALAASYATPAALASLASFGANAGPAQAGIASTVATTNALAAFQDGTDFVRGAGSSISDSILARLSVGEGVVNANANRANPGIVAAMNRGERISGGDTEVNLSVQVINQTSAQIDVQQLSENVVRIIAREEASEAVREEGPEVVAEDINRGYGRVSEALQRQGNFTRRRT